MSKPFDFRDHLVPEQSPASIPQEVSKPFDFRDHLVPEQSPASIPQEVSKPFDFRDHLASAQKTPQTALQQEKTVDSLGYVPANTASSPQIATKPVAIDLEKLGQQYSEQFNSQVQQHKQKTIDQFHARPEVRLKDKISLVENYDDMFAIPEFNAYQQYREKLENHLKQQGYSDAQRNEILTVFDKQVNPYERADTWSNAAQDFGLSLAGGVMRFGERMTSNLGARNFVANGLREAADNYEKAMSAKQKIAKHDTDQKIMQAEQQNGQVAAALAATEMAGKYPAYVANMAATELPSQVIFSMATGGVGAAISGAGLEMGALAIEWANQVESMTHEELMRMPGYRELIKAGKTPAEAKHDFANDNSQLGGWLAVAGGLGSLDRYLSFVNPGKMVGKQAMSKILIRNILSDMAREGAQEGLAQINQNLALSDLDPNRGVFQGVGASTVYGAALGAPMGAIGGGTHIAHNRQEAKRVEAENKVIDPDDTEHTATNSNPPSAPTQIDTESAHFKQQLEQVAEEERNAYKADFESDQRDGLLEQRLKENSAYGDFVRAVMGKPRYQEGKDYVTISTDHIFTSSQPTPKQAVETSQESAKKGKKLTEEDLLTEQGEFTQDNGYRVVSAPSPVDTLSAQQQNAVAQYQQATQKLADWNAQFDKTYEGFFEPDIVSYQRNAHPIYRNLLQQQQSAFEAMQKLGVDEQALAKPQTVSTPQDFRQTDATTQSPTNFAPDKAFQNTLSEAERSGFEPSFRELSQPAEFNNAQWQAMKTLKQAQARHQVVREQARAAFQQDKEAFNRPEFKQSAESLVNALQEMKSLGVSAQQFNQYLDQIPTEPHSDETKFSRSAMKSVEANVKRGREAMNTAIAERRTVHRAMYNNELGWVDFEWGDVGTVRPNGKTKGAMGISHIIDARMRKDNMTYEQATQMLTQNIVDTVAKGEIVGRAEMGNIQSIKLQYGSYLASLTKSKGNNAWIVTAFELFEGANRKGYDKSIPTHTSPTLTRADKGASNVASGSGQFAPSQLNDTHRHSQRGRAVVAENGQTLTNSNSDVNPQTDPEITEARTLLQNALGEHADKIAFVRSSMLDKNDPHYQDKLTAEGWFENGKAYLNVDNIQAGKVLSRAERMAWVGWHELAHQGLEVKFGKVFHNLLNSASQNVVVRGLAHRIQKEHGYEWNVAVEEALVEAYAAFETGNWAEINQRYHVNIAQNWAESKGVGNLLTRLANYFRRLVSAITGKDVTQTMTNAELFETLRGIKQGIHDIAKNPENSTARNTTDEVRYSLNENADSEFAKAVEAVANGEDPTSPVITLGTTPDVLKMLGVDKASVVMNVRTLRKDMIGKHSVSAEAMKQLPQQMNNPIAVVQSRPDSTNPDAYLVLTELNEVADGKNLPVIAALDFAKNEEGNLELVKVASAYGRKNVKVAKDLLYKPYYWNKTKGNQFLKNFSLSSENSGLLSELRTSFLSDDYLSANNIKTESDLSQYQSAQTAENEGDLENTEQEENDIRYSRKAKSTPEYQRDLMVTHNISADGIMHAKKMGGLPYASVAVARQQNPLTGFGEVTLIGDRNYIDPKGENKAKVFGADIYSPRYRDLKMTYDIQESDKQALFERFKFSAETLQDNAFEYDVKQNIQRNGVVNTLKQAYPVKFQFLQENGIEVPFEYHQVERSPYSEYASVKTAIKQGRDLASLENDSDFAEQFVTEFVAKTREKLEGAKGIAQRILTRQLTEVEGFAQMSLREQQNWLANKLSGVIREQANQENPDIDKLKTERNIDEALAPLQNDFEQYVQAIAERIETKEKLENGETRNGTTKYVPHTLENVVKKLKKNLRGGESYNYGLPNARAAATPQFKSIKDIQQNKDRIISHEEFEPIRNAMDAEGARLGEKLRLGYGQIYGMLGTAIEEGIPQAFKEAGVNDTAENRQAVVDYLDKLKAMPTEYFEGKAKDVTQFSDFVGAVVPDNLPVNAYNVLKDAGLPLYEYQAGKPDSRAEVIKQATRELDEQHNGKVLFSRRHTLEDEVNAGQVVPNKRDFSWKAVMAAIDTTFTEDTRPVKDFINGLPIAPQWQKTLRGLLDLAPGKRTALNADYEEKFIKPLVKNIAALANKHHVDILTTKRFVEYWASTRYSIEKNQALLQRDEQAMKDAEQTLLTAQQSGNPQDISLAQIAYNRAERQYRYRKADVETTQWRTHTPHVGTAGGWSIPQAQKIMAGIEQKFPVAEIEQTLVPLFDMLRHKLLVDRKAGRITQQEFLAYLHNRHYVPLTGDPNKDPEMDFIAGTANNAVNAARDKALKGRTSSEAEGAIDATWREITKSNTIAAFAEFKQELSDVYDSLVQSEISNGKTTQEAEHFVAQTYKLSRQKMKGMTRSSDKILVHKMQGQYYEIGLPPKVVDSITHSQTEMVNTILRGFQTVTSWAARGYTQYRVDFALKNMVRDLFERGFFVTSREMYDAQGQNIGVLQRHKIGAQVMSGVFNPKVWNASIRFATLGKAGLRDSVPVEKHFKELIEQGGVSTYGTYLATSESALLKQIRAENAPLSKTLGQAAKVVEKGNQIFDMVSSIASMHALRENNLSSREAAATTLNLSNFRHTGKIMKPVKALYAFSQPTLMGGKNLASHLSTPEGAMQFMVLIGTGMLLYSFLRSMDDEDERGNKMDAAGDLSREIIVPAGNGEYYKIPVPFGMSQLAWNIATNAVRANQKQIRYTDAATNIGLQVVKSGFLPISPSDISAAENPWAKFVMTFVPTFAQPIAQVGENISAFGAKIHPDSNYSSLQKFEQSKPTTAQAWRDLAEKVYDLTGYDQHPEVYQHLIESYGRMLGTLGEVAIAQIENPNRELLGKPTVTPVLNSFYGPKGEGAIQGLYYQAKEKVDDTKREFEYLKRSHKLTPAWFTKERRDMIRLSVQMEEQMKPIDKARQTLLKARKDGKLPDEVFKKRLAMIAKRQEVVQRNLLYRYRKMEGLATYKK